MLWILVVVFEVGCYYRDAYENIGWGIGTWLKELPFVHRALLFWVTFGLVFSFLGPWLFNTLKEAGGETRTVAIWLLISVLVWGTMAALASGINRWHIISFVLIVLGGMSVIKAGG